MKRLQQLAIIKIEDETIFQVCGYYDNIEDANNYIKEVENSVKKKWWNNIPKYKNNINSEKNVKIPEF